MSTILGDILTLGVGSNNESSVYAIISVIYPAGSICTCSKGNTVLTAEDTSGLYNFLVPEAGSWTVSRTDGTSSFSLTAVVSSQYEIVNVDIGPIPNDVNDASWAQISAVSIAGTGDTYWDIGDRKGVSISGGIGSFSISRTLYVFILDFNHPINKTTADNNIIWGGFKTDLTGGSDACLCDDHYGSPVTSGVKFFNMNHAGPSNAGGWKGCDFRYDILGGTSTAPSPYNAVKTSQTIGYDATQDTIDNPVTNTLMSALPSDLRAALRLWNRYIDYKGDQSNSDSNCSSPTIDAISVLSEYEIFGASSISNQYEQNHQKQMAYYSAGNSKIKTRADTGGSAYYWMASPYRFNNAAFGEVSSKGTSGNNSAHGSSGFAPAFRT